METSCPFIFSIFSRADKDLIDADLYSGAVKRLNLERTAQPDAESVSANERL
jgi:hypothetical protein